MVMTWLWNSIEPYISDNFMFHATVTTIWDAAHTKYSLENNISRVFEIDEEAFSFC